MNNRTILLLSIVFSAVVSFAQDTLNIDNALELAFKHNLSLQAGRNRTRIASLNNSVGNAGMLPKVSANLNASGSLASISQKNASGVEVNYPRDTGFTLNPGVTVSWTVFDGLKMFATRSRLDQLEQIGELAYKDSLQNVIAQTIVAYYDIVSAVQQYNGLQKAIAASEERVKIAQVQLQVGAISRVDLLQAQLDLNDQKSAALTQEDLITQKRTNLNSILARPPETEFVTTDSIPFTEAPTLISPVALESKNLQLAVASKNVDVATSTRKEATAQLWPALSLTGAYAYSRGGNRPGPTVLSQNHGFSGGVNLNIPLFNGFNSVHQVQIADLNVSSAQIALDNTRLQVKVRYYQAQRDFQKAKAVLALEEENIKLADENLKIALERFRLAQSTAIEMRTAELSYVQSLTRLVNARFAAKVAETELMRIQGSLVK